MPRDSSLRSLEQNINSAKESNAVPLSRKIILISHFLLIVEPIIREY
jgi:hypothetical protein